MEHIALAFPTLPLNLNRGQKRFGLKNWKCKVAYAAKAAHLVLTYQPTGILLHNSEAAQRSHLKIETKNMKIK